jgi:Tol biopolymer transport system component
MGAVWSPDGRKMAFVSNRTGDDEIYVMDASGGRIMSLR